MSQIQPPIRISNIDIMLTSEIAKLRHPKNPNSHPADQVERLASIIEFQGWRYPIKISTRSGLITAGHGRLDAAELRGWSEVPVSYQDYDSDEQEIADLIADNAIASWSELNFKSINEMVPDLGPDFDLDLLGIRDFTLDAKPTPPGDEDSVPTDAETRCQLGDRWVMGDHVLMCGDASDLANVESLMCSEKADLVVTDPPYNLGSHVSTGLYRNSTAKNAQGKLAETSWDQDFDIKPVIKNLLAVLSDDASMYIFSSHFLAGDIWSETAGMDRIGWCIWDKPNPMPSLQHRHWTWSAELICYATRGKHIFNFTSSGGHDSNVWRFKAEAHSTDHPTQKPVAIPEHAILHSSNEGQLVLDLFGGSGSTLIAAEKTKRRCYMMEIDPKYCDVILKRWEEYAGRSAELASRI